MDIKYKLNDRKMEWRLLVTVKRKSYFKAEKKSYFLDATFLRQPISNSRVDLLFS